MLDENIKTVENSEAHKERVGLCQSMTERGANPYPFYPFINIIQKHSIAVNAFKTWAYYSIGNIDFAKLLTDRLYDRLYEGMNKSKRRVDVVATYFENIKISTSSQQSLTEKSLFSLQKLRSTTNKIEVEEENYLEGALKTFSQEYQKYIKGINDLQALCRNEIKAKILSTDLKPFEEAYNEKKEITRKIKANIQKLISSLQDHHEALIINFNIFFSESINSTRPRSNLLTQIFIFINKIEKAIGQLKGYGLLFIEAYENAAALERKRLTAIKKAFQTFIDKAKDHICRSNNQYFIFAEVILNQIDEEAIKNSILNVHLLVDPKDLDTFLRNSKDALLNLDTLRKFFFSTLLYSPTENILSNFYFRSYGGQLLDSKSTKQEIQIYITLDYLCDVYKLNSKTKDIDLLVSIPLENITVTQDIASECLIVDWVEIGLISKTMKQIKVLMDSNLSTILINDFKVASQFLKTPLKESVSTNPLGDLIELAHQTNLLMSKDSQQMDQTRAERECNTSMKSLNTSSGSVNKEIETARDKGRVLDEINYRDKTVDKKFNGAHITSTGDLLVTLK